MNSVVIPWVPKKLIIGLFKEGIHWIAMELRSDTVAQGKNVLEALKSLHFTLMAHDVLAEEERAKRHRVIRRKHKAPEFSWERARRDGAILEGTVEDIFGKIEIILMGAPPVCTSCGHVLPEPESEKREEDQ